MWGGVDGLLNDEEGGALSYSPLCLSLLFLSHTHTYTLPHTHPLSLTHACTRQEDQVAHAMELAAFFTHCNLQPVHLALSLRSAMTVFFKFGNRATCSSFCRR